MARRPQSPSGPPAALAGVIKGGPRVRSAEPASRLWSPLGRVLVGRAVGSRRLDADSSRASGRGSGPRAPELSGPAGGSHPDAFDATDASESDERGVDAANGEVAPEQVA